MAWLGPAGSNCDALWACLTSPVDDCLYTGGRDGVIRCYDLAAALSAGH